MWLLCKRGLALFYCRSKGREILRIKHFSLYWSDKGIKGTVCESNMYLFLNGGYLNIAPTPYSPFQKEKREYELYKLSYFIIWLTFS